MRSKRRMGAVFSTTDDVIEKRPKLEVKKKKKKEKAKLSVDTDFYETGHYYPNHRGPMYEPNLKKLACKLIPRDEDGEEGYIVTWMEYGVHPITSKRFGPAGGRSCFDYLTNAQMNQLIVCCRKFSRPCEDIRKELLTYHLRKQFKFHE